MSDAEDGTSPEVKAVEAAETAAAVAAALAAGSAAVGRPLSGPVRLPGSDWSVVLRCQDEAGGTVVVKTYPGDGDGPSCFANEAAGLTLSGGTGLAPELLAADPDSLTVVMSDLGSGRSMADVLLADAPDPARSAVLDWAAGCGELSAAASGRHAYFETLKTRYLNGGPDESYMATLLERVRGSADQAAKLTAERRSGLSGVRIPGGLPAELLAVADTIGPGRYPVFTPGDICPDNNLITAEGVRFLDFESAGIYPAFLDAAYIRMPFSTCWCVFRLPADLAAAAETVYRDQIARVHPALADDVTWAAGVRCAVAAWSLSSMYWLLPQSIEQDRPMDAVRESPRRRQLIRHRWQVLAAELETAGELPALAELTRSLLAATEHWQAAELPLYPAFR
jgi:hypothetical protein